MWGPEAQMAQRSCPNWLSLAQTVPPGGLRLEDQGGSLGPPVEGKVRATPLPLCPLMLLPGAPVKPLQVDSEPYP